jgi:flagellar hook-basal body complex protein FliE
MQRPTRRPSLPLVLSLVALLIAVTGSAWGSDASVDQGNTQVTTPTIKTPTVTNAQLKAQLDGITKRLDKLATKVTNIQKANKATFVAQAQRQNNTIKAVVDACQKANNDAREVYSASTGAPWLDIGSCPRIAAVTTPAP